jgi:hypothetical protein
MDWNTFSNDTANRVVESGRLRELLDDLGCGHLKGSAGDRTFRGPCPVHGGRGNNFMVTTGDTLPIRWACWSRQCHEKYKQSLLGLVRAVLSTQKGKDVHPWDAVRWLKEFLKDTPAQSTYSPPPPEPRPQQLNLSREQVRAHLEIPSPYFLTRGYSPATLDAFDVGHSKKLGRSVVPFYDQSGKVCIGYQARSELPTCLTCGKSHPKGGPCSSAVPKWEVLKGFRKGSYLYNYHAVLRSHPSCVLLVEGPGDVWAVTSPRMVAVSCLGCELTEMQAEMLARVKKPVVVTFDNDPSGITGATKAANQLQSFGVKCKQVTLTPAYHDLGSMPYDAVHRWLQNLSI